MLSCWGCHRTVDVTHPPCWDTSGFRGNLTKTHRSWIWSASLCFFKPFLWLGWLLSASGKAKARFSFISVFRLLNTRVGKFETTFLICSSLTFFCEFIWPFYAGGSKATMITDCVSLVLFGGFVVRWWKQDQMWSFSITTGCSAGTCSLLQFCHFLDSCTNYLFKTCLKWRCQAKPNLFCLDAFHRCFFDAAWVVSGEDWQSNFTRLFPLPSQSRPLFANDHKDGESQAKFFNTSKGKISTGS